MLCIQLIQRIYDFDQSVARYLSDAEHAKITSDDERLETALIELVRLLDFLGQHDQAIIFVKQQFPVRPTPQCQKFYAQLLNFADFRRELGCRRVLVFNFTEYQQDMLYELIGNFSCRIARLEFFRPFDRVIIEFIDSVAAETCSDVFHSVLSAFCPVAISDCNFMRSFFPTEASWFAAFIPPFIDWDAFADVPTSPSSATTTSITNSQ